MSLKAPVIILADGPFPVHARPQALLKSAGTLICCDGAARHLDDLRLVPAAIVGDMDSLSPELKARYAGALVERPDQASGDLEKALVWARDQGAAEVFIIGAAGGRDDHAFGNVAMLWTDFGLHVVMITDFGSLERVDGRAELPAFEGQQVGLFPAGPAVKLTTDGLAYNLGGEPLTAMHRGASNVALDDRITIEARGGPVIVFQSHAVP
ncbi:MAG: thiamine diphosphokinase [Candidatus Marinimicrobia bacterium]|nr:thiamine diphosphokinase [Candidatus Neomarinimicrobiota bacterium]